MVLFNKQMDCICGCTVIQCVHTTVMLASVYAELYLIVLGHVNVKPKFAESACVLSIYAE